MRTNYNFILGTGVLVLLGALLLPRPLPATKTEKAPVTNPIANKTLANKTVAVVRLDGRSGGTGVILSSSDKESQILTNSHVCGVVTHGGYVITDDGIKHPVNSIKRSLTHDLCLVKVLEDLHQATIVAEHAPEIYSDAIVAGHPALYPTVITRGHFSQLTNIQIMIGVRACTEEDLQNPDNAINCMFTGEVPIIKEYRAQLVSATIMAGSSGSAVYNDKGELSGLVFAGRGDIGYGFIVPFEYLLFFLKIESKAMSFDPIVTDLSMVQARSQLDILKDKCKAIKNVTGTQPWFCVGLNTGKIL